MAPGKNVQLTIACNEGPTYDSPITPGGNSAIAFTRPEGSEAQQLGLIGFTADESGTWNLTRADSQ